MSNADRKLSKTFEEARQIRSIVRSPISPRHFHGDQSVLRGRQPQRRGLLERTGKQSERRSCCGSIDLSPGQSSGELILTAIVASDDWRNLAGASR